MTMKEDIQHIAAWLEEIALHGSRRILNLRVEAFEYKYVMRFFGLYLFRSYINRTLTSETA